MLVRVILLDYLLINYKNIKLFFILVESNNLFTIKDFINCWDNLFFEKINYPSLGVFRILIGIICLCKIFLLLRNRYEYFGAKGFYPHEAWEIDYKKDTYLSVFHYLKPNNFSVDLVLFFSIISSLFLTIGFCTEFFCSIIYCLFVSLNHRNLYIWNSGDCLLRIILFLLIFSGCGYYLSVDNIIYNRSQLDFCIVPWIVRLIQIVVLNVYFHAVYTKLQNGEVWLKGTGLYYSLSNKMVNRYLLTPYINKYIFVFLNYAILLVESIIVLGLLFEETSTICVFFLIFVHLLFEILLRLNLFGTIMIACLLLFLKNDTMLFVLKP